VSAFYVNTGCIDDIVTLIKPESADQLGRELLLMNRDAVAHRYDIPESNGEYITMTKTAEGYVYQSPETSVKQQAKSIGCFTYQCSEGDIPHRELFVKVSEAESALYKFLWPNEPYSQDPAYQKAKWDRSRKE